MKFIIGEDGMTWLSRFTYRGTIGLFYKTTWGGILTYLIFTIVCILAVIGLITVIAWIVTHKKKKKSKDPYTEWLKTGKMP